MAATCAVQRAFTARPCSQRAGRRCAVAPQAFFSNISKTVSKTIKGGVEKAVETVEKAAPAQGGTQSGTQSGGQTTAARPAAVNIRDAGSHSRKGTVR